MGAVPRTLLVFARDLVVLSAVAVVGGSGIMAACTQVLRLEIAAHPGPAGPLTVEPLDWGAALQSGWGWARAVAVWLAVCWWATRARARGRTAWLPAALAVTTVMLRAALSLVDPGPVIWFDLWPGPAAPYRWHDAGVHPALLHPAWGFLLLLVALLVAASLLAVRSGRATDDAAGALTPPRRRGVALAAVVVGLPAAVGVAGALVAGYVSHTPDGLSAPGLQTVHDVAVPLAAALVAAAVLSGTGLVGGLLVALVTLVTAGPPVLAWMLVLNPVTALGVPAGMLVACAAVALWRPAAVWGADVLTSADVPPAGIQPADG